MLPAINDEVLILLIREHIPITYWKLIQAITKCQFLKADHLHDNRKINYRNRIAGRMDIAIEVPTHPTEDPERVLQAIRNLFPDAIQGATFKSQDIRTLATRISEQMIKDTTRVLLLRSIRGNEIKFHLNKQAAFVGKINFTDGKSVLGDITVRITTDEPEKIARIIAGGSGL